MGARVAVRVVAVSVLLGLTAPRLSPAEDVVVLVSADTEWKVLLQDVGGGRAAATPFGDFFFRSLDVKGRRRPVLFFHGGWGKISAAASAQYAVDRWKPRLLVNIGTCGGFAGAIAKGDVILVDRTVVYDIVEQMGDAAEAIAAYATTLDVSWTGGDYPEGVRRGILVSGDRDIVPAEIPRLRESYGAVAADWESGAIAFVARSNRTPLLILRGVSDLVGPAGGEAYGDPGQFEAGARTVMKGLLAQLPFWLDRWDARKRMDSPAYSR